MHQSLIKVQGCGRQSQGGPFILSREVHSKPRRSTKLLHRLRFVQNIAQMLSRTSVVSSTMQRRRTAGTCWFAIGSGLELQGAPRAHDSL
ncbi:hypothetical protein P692DRAFT_2079921 [Suillus brevipes Sb2]|nr:hypothetical protein P692DRAFT_2079921 [Suillus brevipes Sb2]